MWSVEIVDNDEDCQDLVHLSMPLPSKSPLRLVHGAHATRRARGDGHSRGVGATTAGAAGALKDIVP